MANPRVLEVVALRNSASYRAAEALRQKKFGGGKAAKKITIKQGTPEYAALRLLIGTWDSIGHQILGLAEPARVEFYETNPVGYMWNLLKAAIQEIRKELGNHYAKNFEDLYEAYDRWLRTQPPAYQTGAGNGMTAQFG